MLIRTLATTTAAVLAMSVATQASILVNFSGSGDDYTTDGTNTWQTFQYDVNPDNGAFDDIASTTLVDAAGSNTSITFALTGNGQQEFGNGGATEAQFTATKPATGFDWFDESVANQRQTSATNNAGDVVYIFAGFNPSDVVTFNFVFGRNSTGERQITFTDLNNNTDLLSFANTASTGVYLSTTLTGSSSYSFAASKAEDNDSPASVVNAMQIDIVPEPATASLIALGSAMILVRRRTS